MATKGKDIMTWKTMIYQRWANLAMDISQNSRMDGQSMARREITPAVRQNTAIIPLHHTGRNHTIDLFRSADTHLHPGKVLHTISLLIHLLHHQERDLPIIHHQEKDLPLHQSEVLLSMVICLHHHLGEVLHTTSLFILLLHH
jgi:hypothetical protein